MADSTLRYEILIGGWGNRITALRRSDGNDTNNVSEKFNIDGLLDCNQYRLLWASWEDGTITLGTGGIIGQNVQCSWTDPNFFEVKSAGIYSRNYDGDWKIEIDGIRVRYQIRTVDSKPLGFFDFNVITDYVTDLAKYGRNKTETLVFEVKICLQAKLFMSNSEIMSDSTLRCNGSESWMEWHAIRRSDGIETNDVSEKFNTVGLLDCNQYRLLWASWEDGTIKFGTGGIIGDNLQCS
ncbi:unnamed protein product [Mytilus edulis]|uniref:Farnesoic acid O-methyl transferase domain-containing protein n=1 Tax=Mytilus edulis TaxID=6550 RepID=A0A8S3V4U0_MYTED|nr:unnamed protein product [Mytilus edulis]